MVNEPDDEGRDDERPPAAAARARRRGGPPIPSMGPAPTAAAPAGETAAPVTPVTPAEPAAPAAVAPPAVAPPVILPASKTVDSDAGTPPPRRTLGPPSGASATRGPRASRGALIACVAILAAIATAAAIGVTTLGHHHSSGHSAASTATGGPGASNGTTPPASSSAATPASASTTPPGATTAAAASASAPASVTVTRVVATGFAFSVPTGSGWSISDPQTSPNGRLSMRTLSGPDGEQIWMYDTPDTVAKPAASTVVSTQPLGLSGVAHSALDVLNDFPKGSCATRTCDDYVLNDSRFGGLAILASDSGGPASRVAVKIAESVDAQ